MEKRSTQDRRSFILNSTILGAAVGGSLATSKSFATTPTETTDIPDDALFEYKDNLGAASEVRFEHIKRLSNSISVLQFHKDVGTGDSAIDHAAINAGLQSLQKGQSLYLPSNLPHPYKIDISLIEPSVSHWGLVSDPGAYAEIDISDMPTGEYLISPSKRGWSMHNFYIYGNGGASGSSHNYTANGLNISEAAFSMSHLRFLGLHNALRFSGAHDSQLIDTIECHSNYIDIHFDGVGGDNGCSSLRFRNFSSVLSEISILQERPLTNMLFDSCTFAPAPYDSNVKPINFSKNMFGCCIRNSRIEMHTHHSSGPWDAIYLFGVADTLPISSLSITDNHFTGAIKHTVYADRYVNGLKFHDNSLLSDPEMIDLFLGPKVLNTSIKRNHVNNPNREISISHDPKSTMIEAVVDRSYPMSLNGNGDPEGAINAPKNSTFMRADGTPGSSFYRKDTDAGDKSGWTAVF